MNSVARFILFPFCSFVFFRGSFSTTFALWVQPVKKLFWASNTWKVAMILSRFLFSSEVVSHIAFGNTSHLHSWVYSLFPNRGENDSMRHVTAYQKADPRLLFPICRALVSSVLLGIINLIGGTLVFSPHFMEHRMPTSINTRTQ